MSFRTSRFKTNIIPSCNECHGVVVRCVTSLFSHWKVQEINLALTNDQCEFKDKTINITKVLNTLLPKNLEITEKLPETNRFPFQDFPASLWLFLFRWCTALSLDLPLQKHAQYEYYLWLRHIQRWNVQSKSKVTKPDPTNNES